MNEEKFLDAIENAGTDTILNLPCGKIQNLIDQAKQRIEYIDLYREEEGIGISAGLSMAGHKPAMLIQSSGIGNCVNAILSLTECYKLPLPLLISWRGVYGEKIEAQKPLGRRLPRLLKAMDIPYRVYNGKNNQEITRFIKQTYMENKISATLLRPDIWSESEDHQFSRPDIKPRQTNYKQATAKHTRSEIIEGIKEQLKGKIVVSNIGIPSRELYSIQDQPTNFYMLGSLGLATPIGLGLTKTDKQVIVIDGDGSILMNPTSLFTTANIDPENITILAIDNASYGSTGCQQTAAKKSDLQQLADSAGLKTARATTPEEIKQHIQQKQYIHIPTQPGNKQVPVIPYTAQEIKKRFTKNIQR
ncbi:sulfopyruvate decarboxylase subunit alpha [Methanonatronarchaeum sp. AMET6-2]|uniref:sulfopyruvate decarboxylase subunit alpha n=1 Tax=Methanonatronarchaeum sp. AMET6-2 TaxID=2933293 RepID=UPI001FF6C4F3|nr:sulfopyruvate decarboxylase subunit alpha [Methanonatronarchaeum sp. AMET6-2]UOY09943.1 sulfopyruvate decarboxylase subunit alpha [Methanonatronarchaeum sp. AMET6-2]